MMKRIGTVVLGAALFAAPAYAKPGDAPVKQGPAMQKAMEKAQLESSQRTARRAILDETIQPGELIAQLEDVLGEFSVRVSTPIEQGVTEKTYVALGYKQAKNAADATHRAVFNGRVYTELQVEGFDAQDLEKLKGQTLKLTMRQMTDGRWVVASFAPTSK